MLWRAENGVFAQPLVYGGPDVTVGDLDALLSARPAMKTIRLSDSGEPVLAE